MTLTKRGQFYFGDTQADIQAELVRYSQKHGYLAEHFAEARCSCGSHSFRLLLDDTEGAAVRTCSHCGIQHPIGDSAEYLEEARLEECACPCGQETFEITVGVSLYEDSQDVRWLFLGCRCPTCGLTATYGDWKNEYPGYRELLAKV